MMAAQMVEIRWHGRGGQGAKTAAMFVAHAVLAKGKFGQGFPEYGPERRGAPMRGYTRIAETPIRRHCGIENPGIVVVLDPTLLDSPAAGVTAGTDKDTIFLVNTSLTPAQIKAKLGVKGAKVYTVDATKIALDAFGKPIPNMPMTGALMAAKPVLTLAELLSAVKEKFGKKFSQAVVEGNLRAVEQAYNEVVSA
ncbi:MAG TPA: 2-oxoacid:acceptor oxidoreductase family protein [Candidatus Krumholzibacteria bacterium]|nr:2-oxoacid:acceptor oxidoreductase family protein [Candidatus Krumholzibacteria bacterium]HPD70931.1 2-oxoacid:acceptor oxidoreductase family protein [Candidatus Krumholzibacteria bacterium]HRY39369.1 2-oxoacid:acceptor oxidoreductase family protein [Candidatus Krumholzibacteria bacterium]